ncbi:hypothetical protein L204_101162 [Cryptococcus depauperatus]|nr:hypothetical protein L204_00906 [Cryptococcus depauperatus CBS 7855]
MAFLFVVVLYNVPLGSTDDSNLAGRAWLVTVGAARGGGINSSAGKTYGFGIWGWCSWTEGVNGGHCKKKTIWRLPRDAGSDTGVRSLNLPTEISHALSITGFLLVFILASVVIFWGALITAFFYRYERQIATKESVACCPSNTKARKYLAQVLRNRWLNATRAFFVLLLMLPVVVFAGVGYGKLNHNFECSLGLGWGFAVVSIILLEAVIGLIAWYGLRIKAKS